MKNLGTYRGAPFVTSSYSHPSECVAVARPAGAPVAVLDSKDPSGPRLEFTRKAWAAFLADIPQSA
ncbi:DUF397 domain-containing protein [Actinacidiphila acidipaludis]|uniref:DUF397 domain-containing protein n=1 Tax=Actinacidiphila acidipaludis TaxID=2873382 RepID=A0ABS7Q9U9_9ACTN|nr:DUF397 domain-containing protein [Streptomyces acidipaludis]MBY8879738.1 DUF397 domain-containing protein [Streptomyces acidipaludis]